MSTPEFSESQRGGAELPIDLAQELADVQHTCETAIREIVAAAERGETSAAITAETGRMIEAAAVSAAEREDSALFEQHLDALLRLPGLADPTLARACLAGVSIGNQRAFSLLESILAGERNKVQRKRDGKPEEFDRRPEAAYATGKSLRGLIEVYAEKGIPPDAWIERVAINPLHRWALVMDYFTILKEKGKLDTAEARAQHATEAEKLLDRETFPDSFIFTMSHYALEAATDPDTRARLISNYRDAVLEQTPQHALSRFPSVIDTAHKFAIAPRPAGGTPAEDAAMLKAQQTIEELTLIMTGAGYGTMAAFWSFKWEVDKKMYEGATPQQLVEAMNAQARQLLEETDYDPLVITASMNGLLEEYAELYASRGDFTAAAFFVANTSHEIVMYTALGNCLKHAKTLDDIRALRPDELSLQTERDLDFQFRTAEGCQGRNVEALEQLSGEIITAIGEDSPQLHLYDLLQSIQGTLLDVDRPRALALTKEWLAALRAKQENPALYQELSAALIDSGDAAEAIERFKSLDNGTSLKADQRLQALWLLLRSIKTTFPNLPELRPRGGSEATPATSAEGEGEGDAMLRLIRRIIDTL